MTTPVDPAVVDRTLGAWSLLRDPRLGLPLLVLAGAVLIFTGLDNRHLWDDEAETALLARNVLQFGVPVAWDGRDLVSQECGTDYGPNYLWRQTPWLPIYVMAGSFAVFGEGTWSARLPFALLGVACLASLYPLGLRLFRDRDTALLAVGALLVCVPFLVYARQGRYYSLAVFAAIWLLYCFWATVEGSRVAVAGLAAAFTALLHSSHLAAGGMTLGLAASLAFVRPDRHALARLGIATLAALAFNGPWLAGGDTPMTSSVAWSLGAPARFAGHVLDYLRDLELYAYPSAAIAAILGWRLWRDPPDTVRPELRPVLALGVVAIVHVLVVSALPWRFFRYVVTLLPVMALLFAWAVRTVGQRHTLAAVLIFAAAAGIDRADAVRGNLGSSLVKYRDDVVRRFEGPVEAMVRYLRSEGRPGQRLFISYGDLPLRFYTDLHIQGGQGCQPLVLTPLPDWIVVRHFFRFANPSPGSSEDMARVAHALRHDIPWQRYRRVDLGVVDTIWENIPEPDRRVYRTPTRGPGLVLYRLSEPR